MHESPKWRNIIGRAFILIHLKRNAELFIYLFIFQTWFFLILFFRSEYFKLTGNFKSKFTNGMNNVAVNCSFQWFNHYFILFVLHIKKRMHSCTNKREHTCISDRIFAKWVSMAPPWGKFWFILFISSVKQLKAITSVEIPPRHTCRHTRLVINAH